MHHPAYDIKISGEELQPVGEVTPMNSRHVNPARYATSFEAPRLKSRLGSLLSGELYLDQDEFSAIDLASSGLKGALTLLPGDFSKARQQSRTDVQFAQLLLEDSRVGQKAELVAVKYTSPPLAAREFAAMKFINTAGLSGIQAPGAFTPLGFIRRPTEDAKSPQVGLVTRYEHSVLTLDRIFWDKDHTPGEEELVHAFGIAAVWLARLHGNNMAHGDAQPKNIGHGNIDVPRYGDLEGATNFNVAKGRIDTAQARTYVTDDLETFLTSLGGNYTDLIPEHFTRPYVTRMEAATGEVVRLSEDEIIAISKEDQKPIIEFKAYI